MTLASHNFKSRLLHKSWNFAYQCFNRNDAPPWLLYHYATSSLSWTCIGFYKNGQKGRTKGLREFPDRILIDCCLISLRKWCIMIMLLLKITRWETCIFIYHRHFVRLFFRGFFCRCYSECVYTRQTEKFLDHCGNRTRDLWFASQNQTPQGSFALIAKANSQVRYENFHPITIFESTRCELTSWLLRWVKKRLSLVPLQTHDIRTYQIFI